MGAARLIMLCPVAKVGSVPFFEYINCEREKSMKSVVICMIAASLMVGGSAMATDMPAIAKKNECNACHAIDKKVVGPAWMDIARKYKGDATAKDRLTAKILKGGGGVWGAMPMPGNPKLSEADAAMLANFILGLAK